MFQGKAWRSFEAQRTHVREHSKPRRNAALGHEMCLLTHFQPHLVNPQK